jgi:hypothetical protein
MELLMSSVFNDKIIINDDEIKEPSILKGLTDESLKYVDDVEPRFYIDEEVEENDTYKWYEMIDGQKVRRNNIDPTLTHDGLPTIETQLKNLEQIDLERQSKELTEEERDKKYKREMLQRIRCIALNAMGKNILQNPKTLSPKDKREFIKRIEELYILSEDEIKIMFGNICHDTIFQNGSDYSTYVVYDV